MERRRGGGHGDTGNSGSGEVGWRRGGVVVGEEARRHRNESLPSSGLAGLRTSDQNVHRLQEGINFFFLITVEIQDCETNTVRISALPSRSHGRTTWW